MQLLLPIRSERMLLTRPGSLNGYDESSCGPPMAYSCRRDCESSMQAPRQSPAQQGLWIVLFMPVTVGK